MKTAFALAAFAFGPLATLASDRDGVGSVSMKQQPGRLIDVCDAMKKLRPGMDAIAALRRLPLPELAEFAKPGGDWVTANIAGLSMTINHEYRLRIRIHGGIFDSAALYHGDQLIGSVGKIID